MQNLVDPSFQTTTFAFTCSFSPGSRQHVKSKKPCNHMVRGRLCAKEPLSRTLQKDKLCEKKGQLHAHMHPASKRNSQRKRHEQSGRCAKQVLSSTPPIQMLFKKQSKQSKQSKQRRETCAKMYVDLHLKER